MYEKPQSTAIAQGSGVVDVSLSAKVDFGGIAEEQIGPRGAVACALPVGCTDGVKGDLGAIKESISGFGIGPILCLLGNTAGGVVGGLGGIEDEALGASLIAEGGIAEVLLGPVVGFWDVGGWAIEV